MEDSIKGTLERLKLNGKNIQKIVSPNLFRDVVDAESFKTELYRWREYVPWSELGIMSDIDVLLFDYKETYNYLVKVQNEI